MLPGVFRNSSTTETNSGESQFHEQIQISQLQTHSRLYICCLKMSVVFEGMRLTFFEGIFQMDLLLKACFINLVYIFIGISLLLFSYSYAKKKGLLLGNGE